MLIDDSKNGLVVNQFAFLGMLLAFVAVMVLGHFYRQIHALEGLLAVGWFLSLLLAMERDLFSLISGEHAQALVGGCDVCAAAEFVNQWHHLGPGHVDPSDDVVLEAQAGAGVTSPTNDLHNFGNAVAGRSNTMPTK